MLVSRLRSIIAAAGLNFRVRDENGCFPSAMGTEEAPPLTYTVVASIAMSMQCVLKGSDKERSVRDLHQLLVNLPYLPRLT